MFTYNNQNKNKNIKDQSSSPPRTSGSFETPLRSLSVHYQSISYHRYRSLLSPSIVAPSHAVRSRCDDSKCANRGSSFSCLQNIRRTFATFAGNDVRIDETIPPRVARVQRRPAFCTPSPRAPAHLLPVCVLCGVWSPNLSLEEVYIQVFFCCLFVCF